MSKRSFIETVNIDDEETMVPLPNQKSSKPSQQEQLSNSTTMMLLHNLTCKICTKVAINPVELRCGHLFCMACIESHVKIKPECPLSYNPKPCFPIGMSYPFEVSRTLSEISMTLFPDMHPVQSTEEKEKECKKKILESAAFTIKANMYNVNSNYLQSLSLFLSEIGDLGKLKYCHCLLPRVPKQSKFGFFISCPRFISGKEDSAHCNIGIENVDMSELKKQC